jgi:pyridoxal phosphate enzyme (YggS family)
VIEEAVEAGQLRFGENRIQEAIDKIPQLPNPALQWHLIGHLQSNKARRAVELFDMIETLDRPKIVRRVGALAEDLGKDLEVLIQVNVGAEVQKSGINPKELPTIVDLVESFPRLKLRGLMAIPPYASDPEASRPYFRELRRLVEQLNKNRSAPLPELSMGMSHDFQIAIEEGATLVRVGTAIFGRRG